MTSKTTTSLTAGQRELALRRELEQLQHINDSISRTITAISLAREKCAQLTDTCNITHGMFDQWSGIFSQAIYARQVLSSPLWDGLDTLLLDTDAGAKKAARERVLLETLQQYKAKNVATRNQLDKLSARSTPSASTLGLQKSLRVIKKPLSRPGRYLSQ